MVKKGEVDLSLVEGPSSLLFSSYDRNSVRWIGNEFLLLYPHMIIGLTREVRK